MDIIREDCIYARQSVDRKDSISIESQIDFCKYELKGGNCKVFKDKEDCSTQEDIFNYPQNDKSEAAENPLPHFSIMTTINEQIQNIAQKKDTLCRRMYN